MNIALILLIVANVSTTHKWCMYGECPSGVLRYNCEDFTHDAVLLLRKNNVTSFPLCGSYAYGEEHAWVGVEYNHTLYNIEPQTDRIVYPNSTNYMRGHVCAVRGLV